MLIITILKKKGVRREKKTKKFFYSNISIQNLTQWVEEKFYAISSPHKNFKAFFSMRFCFGATFVVYVGLWRIWVVRY